MSAINESDAVSESRRRPRFLIRPRVPAKFSGTPISVLDLSESGLRVEHATPMKISASGSIQIESEENPTGASIRGRVVWSRLSRVADHLGRFLYQSGVKLDDLPDSVAGIFGRVIHLYGERDSSSIDRKRKVLEDREASRATKGTSAPASVVRITADDVRQIEHAVRELKNHPQTAQEWYNRARYSLANRSTYETPEGMAHYPREVIVIWEYLGGKIDLDVIMKVFENARKA